MNITDYIGLKVLIIFIKTKILNKLILAFQMARIQNKLYKLGSINKEYQKR